MMEHRWDMLGVVFVSAVVVSLSTPLLVVASPALPSRTSRAVTGNPPTKSPKNEFNCLLHWLSVSGASRQEIERLVTSDQLVQAHMDEKSTKTQPLFLLTIILNHNRDLAENLKHCVGRLSSCPTDIGSLDYPCSASGECAFNATTRSTVCLCPPGLVGSRCDDDVDECAEPELNNCASDEYAYCTNIHGSFFCTCNKGYFGDGLQCTDENDCLLGTHDCHGNATCTNTNGSFTCACSHGFRGDGRQCDVDICQGSKETALCHAVQKINDYNQALEHKLQSREQQIHRMNRDMRVMAGMLTRYADTISQLSKRVEQGLTSAAEDRLWMKQEENRKCGLVSWKTFTQQTSTEVLSSWNAVFNKTRADTVVRVTYTSTIGIQAHGKVWECFTRSVLINGSECTDPAPIRSGATAYSQFYYIHFILPGSISGICKVPQAGLLTLSVGTDKQCTHPSYSKYDGYYKGSGSTVTSTMHVEELCAN